MKLREENKRLVNEFLTVNQIEKGPYPVTLDRMMELIKSFAPNTFFMRGCVARVLTERFDKAQNRKTNKQEYFISRSI